MSTELFQEVFLPTQSQHNPRPDAPAATTIPRPVEIGIIIASIVFACIVSLYAIVSVPRAIGSRGKKVTTAAASKIAPVILHHKPLPEKKRKRLLE